MTQDVPNATESLASFQAVRQLQQLHDQLKPYRGASGVSRFLECQGEAVGVRRRAVHLKLPVSR